MPPLRANADDASLVIESSPTAIRASFMISLLAARKYSPDEPTISRMPSDGASWLRSMQAQFTDRATPSYMNADGSPGARSTWRRRPREMAHDRRARVAKPHGELR